MMIVDFLVVVSGPSSVPLGVQSFQKAPALVSLADAQQMDAARVFQEDSIDVVCRQLIGRDDTCKLLRHLRVLLQHTSPLGRSNE